MPTVALMSSSKETDNKLRWVADIDGVDFLLYIPKHSVPVPWPQRIVVSIEELDRNNVNSPVLPEAPKDEGWDAISAIIRKVATNTETIRYCPLGHRDEWELGEPYIPKSLLSDPPPDYLWISVRWDQNSGPW